MHEWRHMAITGLVACLLSAGCSERNLSPEVQALMAEAEAGDADAQFRVGSAYDSGKGAPRDREKAMRWWRRAAESGHAEAQNTVGWRLRVLGRYAEAMEWYRRAAAQDHAPAINNLGYIYDDGLGVVRDRERAYHLYSRAAELGWAESMWNIARLHLTGGLGKQDTYRACLWFVRASAHAEVDSRTYVQSTETVGLLQEELGEERFKDCRKEAAAWEAPASPDEAVTEPSKT